MNSFAINQFNLEFYRVNLVIVLMQHANEIVISLKA